MSYNLMVLHSYSADPLGTHTCDNWGRAPTKQIDALGTNLPKAESRLLKVLPLFPTIGVTF